jgi:hypothetical protein
MEKIEPYWHKNKKWYYYDAKTHIFKLTDQAPLKAVESYIEYLSRLTNS